MTNRSDTIVAIATARGEGGIGMIRLSGPQSARISQQLFTPKKKTETPWPSHVLLYGMFHERDAEKTLDDGFAVRMEPPHSYTGEEVVELESHGSPPILEIIVSLAKSLGARLAEPGEFTKRAFLNGKLDLVQAEAVAELIRSRSEAEARAAHLRLEGRLSSALHRLREETVALLAEIEAGVDFPEEELSLMSRRQNSKIIEQLQIVTKNLLTTYEATKRLNDGYSVALVGRPNVGKSSLFNALLTQDRAIVTEIPGTTRDLLREELILGGRRVRLIDTAGLRAEAENEVERIGMNRTSTQMNCADLICFVADASDGLTDEEKRIAAQVGGKRVWWIWNKIDVKKPPHLPFQVEQEFSVSALRGDGVLSLREALGEAATRFSEISSEGGISNDRQKGLLEKFLSGLEKADEGWNKGLSPEFIAFDLREAHGSLSRLLGKDEGIEEILSEIFSKFCIGK